MAAAAYAATEPVPTADCEAAAGLRPRFLGVLGGSCSDFRLRPRRTLAIAACTNGAPGSVLGATKGIFTRSFPGLFSTTRFTATPSVACRTLPLPFGRPLPRPEGLTTLGFFGGLFSLRDGLPRPVTVKSKSLGSVEVSPTFWKYAMSSTLERKAFPSGLKNKNKSFTMTVI